MKPSIYLFQGQWYCDSDWDNFHCYKTGATPQESYAKWAKAARNIKYVTQMRVCNGG